MSENGRPPPQRALVQAEILRAQLALDPTEFALRLGLKRNQYDDYVRIGHLPQIVRNAVRGLAARARLDPECHLLRRIDGHLDLVPIRDVRTAVIDGQLCVVLPIPGGLRSAAPVSDHEMVILAILGLLKTGEVVTPAALCERLAERLAQWYPEHAETWRRARINHIVWSECHRAEARLRRVRRGHYGLSDSAR